MASEPVSLEEPERSRQRLLRRVRKDETTGCWLWLGRIGTNGYGQTFVPNPRRNMRAHRASYEVFRGPIPEGMQLDHLCRVSRCINPDHLEPVTNRENTLRGASPSALAYRNNVCRSGRHKLEGENIAWINDGKHRLCYACRRESQNAYERKQRRDAKAAGVGAQR